MQQGGFEVISSFQNSLIGEQYGDSTVENNHHINSDTPMQ